MAAPKSFNIDTTDKLFFNIKDLFEYNPEFFYGCTVKKRHIIKKKSIPETEYVYANFHTKTKEWHLSDESCKKAQLLITKEWIDKHYFKKAIAASPPIAAATVMPVSAAVPIAEATPVAATPYQKEDQEIIEAVPPILELTDDEKFRDTDGNIIHIETRGEKDRNKILFDVKDVMTAFDMQNLDITLRDIRGNYILDIHYKRYYIRSSQVKNLWPMIKNQHHINSSQAESSRLTIKKRLYLTYKGLLRVLFASNNKQADNFQDWAEDKLFTIQLGTKETKEVLGTEILNINIENYRAVFGKYPQGFPCIYLLSLGKVGPLRETFGISEEIDNELTVYKYGFTCDIKRRLGEHNNYYGRLKNVTIELEIFNYVDLKYTAEAEADVRDIFETYETVLDISGKRELIALNTKQYERIKKEYVRTAREFAGATKELQEEVMALKQEIQNVKNKMKVQELEHKLAIKEIEKYKTLVETNERIHALEKCNYELRLGNQISCK